MSDQTPTNCSGSCEGCDANCDQRDLRTPGNTFSDIKRVIGVVSGKGGVGKSLVTSLLATATQTSGYATAILDADITGPSIPRAFGVSSRIETTEMGLMPAQSRLGIKMMSVNLLLPREDDPVVWRGPVISGAINQFWSEVAWGNIDYMFVDMPPGTGDVALTVFQSLPVDGIVVVTTPQELVTMIVRKAFHMAEKMQVPVLGIVENMSYFVCPDCGGKHAIFGESHLEEVAKSLNTEVLAQLPMNAGIARLVDQGAVELVEDKGLLEGAKRIMEKLPVEAHH